MDYKLPQVWSCGSESVMLMNIYAVVMFDVVAVFVLHTVYIVGIHSCVYVAFIFKLSAQTPCIVRLLPKPSIGQREIIQANSF